MTMAKYSNEQWRCMANTLTPLLSRRDLIGYAAAVNTRRIGDAISEYEHIRGEVVKEYGTQDDNGGYFIAIGTPEYMDYERAISEVAAIEQEVNIMTVPLERACGELSGEELLDCWWMFSEEEEGEE